VKKQATNFIFLLIICATWFFIGWTVRSRRPPDADATLIEQVRQQLLAEHPGEVPSNRELTYAAIRGMLGSVDDPQAALLTPPVSQRFWDDFNGNSGVIGLFPEKLGGEMVVSVVFPGEPADQAGLRVGDVILSVDGVKFDAQTSNAEAALLIRGPVGVPARFVVRRGDEVLELNPVRQVRTIVEAQMLDSGIMHLTQHTFTANSPQKVRQALQELLPQRPTGLIWDLRSNGGGSMLAAQEILSYFIADGLLFEAELKGGEQQQFMATGDSLATDVPLVVLIGERTYSSAETAAVAIRDRQRGALVGETSYGKGTIQNTEPLIEECLLQMTIARWLSPLGQWYEGRGVEPDFVVSDDESTEQDEVLQFAVDYIEQNF
jgi:carboxyl-terminal processing protease